jgi:adenylate cyclase
MNSHALLGQVLGRLGDDVQARLHLEQALALFHQHRPPTFTLDFLWSGIWAALGSIQTVLWRLGYPDQALRQSIEALALAQEISHPLAITGMYQFAAITHLLRREPHAVREHTEVYIPIATEHGFPQFQAWGLSS